MNLKKLVAVAFAAVLLYGQQADTRRADTKRAKKELESGWNKWIAEDAAYIISDEEKRAFGQLGNDDEREQFVEQFWLRRDPTPDTVENEYKEEHYRRIAYANEHFACGIPGWRADRGRIYIRFGPPDEIDAHPSGGTYERPASEGGGTTSAYPFEQWRYRHLDNVGDDVVVEFVDTSMSGEYRLTIDPCEKDALTYVPGAGPTMAESLGLSTKQARFQNTDGTHCGAPLGAKSENDNEFSRVERLANLERPPAIKFRDLETAVSSRISFNILPMRVQVDYLRVTDFSVLANVTVQFENRDLQFRSAEGVEKSGVHILGRVYTVTRRSVATFEAPLEVIAPAGMVEQYSRLRSVYQKSLPLAPGKYKLELTAKDIVSGNINRMEVALDVPRYEEDKLSTGSLILADTLEKLPTRTIGGSMFAIGDMKVRPRVGAQFAASEQLGVYLQVYNAGGEPGVVSYDIENAATREQKIELSESLAPAPGVAAQLTLSKAIPLRGYDPGTYTLRIKVTKGAQETIQKATFSVTP